MASATPKKTARHAAPKDRTKMRPLARMILAMSVAAPALAIAPAYTGATGTTTTTAGAQVQAAQLGNADKARPDGGRDAKAKGKDEAKAQRDARAADKRSGKSDTAKLRAQLAQLQGRAARVIDDYQGKRDDLAAAKKAERRAEARADESRRALESVRTQVTALATQAYQTGGAGPAAGLPSGTSPRDALDRAFALERMSAQHRGVLVRYAEMLDASVRDQDQAREHTARLERLTDELSARKAKVNKLIDEVEGKLAAAAGPTRASDYPPQGMTGADNLTPRTRQARDLVSGKFDLKYTVGCWRALEDGGEHPRGRACDFMMSPEDQMPSESMQRFGDDVASWLQDNARGLGVMYIIWKQRIWDSRQPDAGWVPMEDRGSVSQNHHDHVHVSMF